ncbi:MFS transporter [Trinickia violacea]|uniref:MFS transporter n=1 Tax=Trinickia violacea TaxID=2571746 RepID=A0A4P8IPB5_9BURK|nr:MFS transporter [Trinickia violacea]QCP48694.1 MFS transporter [Trinickia violacea]
MKSANEPWTRESAGLSALPSQAPALQVTAAADADSLEPTLPTLTPLSGATLTPPLPPLPSAPASHETPRHSLQATAILLFGYAILITGNGLLSTLISLRLIEQQTPALVVGVVQSAYYAGFMVGALWGGGLIRRVGHHRAFVAFAAFSACCALGFAVWRAAPVWVALRFVMGFSLVGIFTVIESWLHQVASNAHRGRVFSAYLITNYLGVGIGQFLLGLADPAGFELFSVVSALFSASLIPVALAGGAPAQASAHGAAHSPAHSPVTASGESVAQDGPSKLARGLSGLGIVYRWAPLGVFGCLAAGLLNSSFYTMQPIFMRRLDYSVVDVSHFMGFALLAALLPQWPVARLADLVDRRAVIAAVSALTAACCVLLFVLQKGGLAVAIDYLYVAVVFSLYGVVTSYVNDGTPSDQRIPVSSALLLIFSLGASGGPTLASAAMALVGPRGLYLFAAIVTGTLTVLTLRSLRAVPRLRG